MTEDEIILRCKEYIKQLFENDSTGHDYNHSIRVLNNAISIYQNEQVEANLFIIQLASLLHDVDDYKLFDTVDYENARKFLNENNVDNNLSNKIIQIISEVPFKAKDTITPKTIEAKIVQDADRLDAIGAIGIARAFAYGGKHNRQLYSKHVDKNNDISFEEYKKSSSDTISHFYIKLLHLKNLMNTNYAKKEAIRRTDYMISFLNEFYKEVD